MGHIPYAYNIPLLDDDERHAVGLTYKRDGQEIATSIGLALFARKAGEFLKSVEKIVPERGQVLLHCWRGGMRSQSVAVWLASMGYQPMVIEGGYKAFRRQVLDTLDHLACHPMLVLDGRTGSGKTDLIKDLRDQLPTIDLEGHAGHR